MQINHRSRGFLACSFSFVLLAACSSPGTRIDSSKAAYDSYPPEVQQKIAAGQVDIGFTPEQALIALGKPRRKFNRTTTTGQAEVWSYSAKTGPAFSFGLGLGSFGSNVGGGVSASTYGNDAEERLRLVFENGKVIAVEEVLK